MAVTYEGPVAFTGGGIQSSLTFDVTVPAGLSNPGVEVVAYTGDTGTTVASVTVDGVPATFVVRGGSAPAGENAGNDYDTSRWIVTGIDAGTREVVVTFDSTGETWAHAVAIDGVDQASPVRDSAAVRGHSTNDFGGNPSVSVDSDTDDLVIDAISINGGGTWSADSGQTVFVSDTSSDDKYAGHQSGQAGSTEAAWLNDGFGGVVLSLTAVSYQPASTGGGTVELAGTATSESTASADASVTRPVSGTAASTSTASGSLSRARPLSATVASESDASAALSTDRALSGTATSESQASGALSRARDVAGAVVSESTASGGVEVARGLAGTVTSVSAASGALTTDEIVTLAGTAASTSAASGALSRARPLSGTTASTSAASASLSRARAFGGAIESTSTVSAHLTMQRALAATAASVSTASGVLTVPGAELDLRPPFTAAWVDPSRIASWTDPARTASWTDPDRTATWRKE